MCGIAGIITTKPEFFDYSTFCHLGIDNDSRGGDSCGIFIDGNYEYGATEKNKYFQDFFWDSKLLSSTIKSTVALLHCRKASVGAKTEAQAQPVIIKNAEGTVDFVMIHNGTIYNYKELAKKYIPDVDIKDLTDSQVMARIFYSAGYKALNEYYGGGVFVMVDYRDGSPATYLFKGASKEYSTSFKETEERPLYYTLDEKREELIFSSLLPHLYVSRYWLDAKPLETNVLYKFTGTTLHAEAVYDRKNVTQRAPVVTTYASTVITPSSNVSSGYIFGDINSLLYKFHNKLCHGEFIVGSTGYVLEHESKFTKNLWFFHGYMLQGKTAFDMLVRKQAKSGLTDLAFDSKFEGLIRFNTMSKLYRENGLVMKSSGIGHGAPYTGDIKLYGSDSVYSFKDGVQCGFNYKFGGYSVNGYGTEEEGWD